SYGELNARANRLAHYLRQLGVGPDDRVGICVERGIGMVVAVLATLKAGGAYVPLDPAYPPERLTYMLKDSAPRVLLTDSRNKAVLTGYMTGARIIDLDADAPLLAQKSERDPYRVEVGLSGRNLAYIIYTSGSTGAPKGVAVEHGNITRLLMATEKW